MIQHEPEEPLECPECGSSDLQPLPYSDMDEMGSSVPTSLTVPFDCTDCGTSAEAIYEFNGVGY